MTEIKTYDDCNALYRALCERVHVEAISWKNGAETTLWDLWDDACGKLYQELLDYQQGLDDVEEAHAAAEEEARAAAEEYAQERGLK